MTEEPNMDLAAVQLLLTQGYRTLKNHIREFLLLAKSVCFHDNSFILFLERV